MQAKWIKVDLDRYVGFTTMPIIFINLNDDNFYDISNFCSFFYEFNRQTELCIRIDTQYFC